MDDHCISQSLALGVGTEARGLSEDTESRGFIKEREVEGNLDPDLTGFGHIVRDSESKGQSTSAVDSSRVRTDTQIGQHS